MRERETDELEKFLLAIASKITDIGPSYIIKPHQVFSVRIGVFGESDELRISNDPNDLDADGFFFIENRHETRGFWFWKQTVRTMIEHRISAEEFRRRFNTVSKEFASMGVFYNDDHVADPWPSIGTINFDAMQL
jgi:hypothetical protein